MTDWPRWYDCPVLPWIAAPAIVGGLVAIGWIGHALWVAI